MRILFIGAVEFSYASLETLLREKVEVVGIVSTTDIQKYSDFQDIGALARISNIPLHKSSDINSKETINWIRELNPEIIFCLGWSQIIKKELLNLPPGGVVGYHPTLLPKNRGRHPIIWTLVLGLKVCGSTFFFMDEGVDSGDIINQATLEVSIDDNANTLYQKLTRLGQIQLKEIIHDLRNGSINRKAQFHQDATYWRKRNQNDGNIDWRMSPEGIVRLVRALSRPYPGAQFEHNGQMYKVWQAETVELNSCTCEPGKVVQVSDKGIIVACDGGGINLSQVEPPIILETGKYL